MKTKSSLLPNGFTIQKVQFRLEVLLEALERSKKKGDILSPLLLQEAAALTGFHSEWALAHAQARPRFDVARAHLAKEAERLMHFLQ